MLTNRDNSEDRRADSSSWIWIFLNSKVWSFIVSQLTVILTGRKASEVILSSDLSVYQEKTKFLPEEERGGAVSPVNIQDWSSRC